MKRFIYILSALFAINLNASDEVGQYFSAMGRPVDGPYGASVRVAVVEACADRRVDAERSKEIQKLEAALTSDFTVSSTYIFAAPGIDFAPALEQADDNLRRKIEEIQEDLRDSESFARTRVEYHAETGVLELERVEGHHKPAMALTGMDYRLIEGASATLALTCGDLNELHVTQIAALWSEATARSFDPVIDEYRRMHQERKPELAKHADHCFDVWSVLNMVAPEASTIVYHPGEWSAIAADEARIVNFSTTMLLENAATFLDAFRGTGKLVVFALGNDNEQVEACEFMQVALLADGFSAILCSTSDHRDPAAPNECGDYISPDFVDGHPHYMTAPGIHIPLPGAPSGCSLSAPAVSAATAIIWGCFPELTHEQVKSVLIESGLKMSHVSKYLNHLNISGALDLAARM